MANLVKYSGRGFNRQKIASEKVIFSTKNSIFKGIIMKWKPGDFTINDNLGLAHYACPGTQNDWREVGLRILHRTTIIGGPDTIPHKEDGRGSFSFR